MDLLTWDYGIERSRGYRVLRLTRRVEGGSA